MQDPLERAISIPSISAALERPLEPQDVVTVNDAIVRIAAVLGETPWHQHPHDELFVCWEGRFRLDVDRRDPIHLGAGDPLRRPAWRGAPSRRDRTRGHAAGRTTVDVLLSVVRFLVRHAVWSFVIAAVMASCSVPRGGDGMAPGWRKVDPDVEFDGEGYIGQVIAVEQEGQQRPFVSLDDLERWAAEDPSKLPDLLRMFRTVYNSWQPRTGGVYINEATL
jgi:hypothetical protein